MRHSFLVRVQRIVVGIIVLALVGIAFLGARNGGIGVPSLGALHLPGTFGVALGYEVALISGHSGNDSGAVCEDTTGNVTLTEASVNAAVTERTAEWLRGAGATVTILQEYDPRLDDLRADLLLSIHADSCIDASGYKAAGYLYSTTREADARLVACIDSHYPARTGIPHHPNTVTHNMTEYHAFRKIAPTTPAAIIELGFLGGDRDLLQNHPDVAAQGVAESILCFLRGPEPETAATETTEPNRP